MSSCCAATPNATGRTFSRIARGDVAALMLDKRHQGQVALQPVAAPGASWRKRSTHSASAEKPFRNLDGAHADPPFDGAERLAQEADGTLHAAHMGDPDLPNPG